MRRNMLAPYLLSCEVLCVDLDFFLQLRDVRNVYLDGSISQSLHELVAQ